jgi:hypothetical protein
MKPHGCHRPPSLGGVTLPAALAWPVNEPPVRGADVLALLANIIKSPDGKRMALPSVWAQIRGPFGIIARLIVRPGMRGESIADIAQRP